MRQVLFYVPFTDLPIYGYGMMLFLAFVFCLVVAKRLARREGVAPEHIENMAIWIFIFGIAGARITYMIQNGVPVWQFFRIWDGGLVFYGSAIGGVVGYFLVYFFSLRKHNVSSWKVADVVAPCAALGLAFGRLGCLLNGCCYGTVACPDCAAVSFPLPSAPRYAMVAKGYQTDAGFSLVADKTLTVGLVEPSSAAERAGLRSGDVILEVDGLEVFRNVDLGEKLGEKWPRGKNDLLLTVRHANSQEERLHFTPYGLGLHPTQIYESVSTALLFFLLLAYYPFKRHDGMLMVMFMLAYAVHRFLNEMLRVDTEKVAFDMTLSQNISLIVFAAGVVLLLIVRSRPARTPPLAAWPPA
jgi:phosphatidylglycerol:prolipoprotein diacylglycerol transferase